MWLTTQNRTPILGGKVGRWFDEGDLLDAFFGGSTLKGINVASFTPLVNTIEGEFAYHVEVDLPGIDKKDIHVDIKDSLLKVSGERKYSDETRDGDYFHRESSYGKFMRSIELPDGIDVENIHAETKDGVLSITLPKIEKGSAAPTTIKVA